MKIYYLGFKLLKLIIFKVFILICLLQNNYLIATENKPQENLNNPPNTHLKLQPKIKESNNINNVKTYDISTIKSYLRKIIVIESGNLNKKKFNKSKKFNFKTPILPLSDLKIDENTGTVVGFNQGSIYFGGAGDQILASGLSKDHHWNYMILKLNNSYYHPTTQEYLGSLMINIGNAHILKRENLSTLKIDYFLEPIKVGMFVAPSTSLIVPDKIELSPSKINLIGNIIAIIPNLTKAASNSIVIIDLGAREGVQVGNIFKIKSHPLKFRNPYNYTTEYLHQPENYKGEILIYDVFTKLSVGIILKSLQEIVDLDQVIST